MATRRRRKKTDAEDWSVYGLNIDPDELRRRRLIDKNKLDEEIEQQSQLYGEAAEAAAMAKSHIEALEEEIKTHEAALDMSIREDAESSEEKITEAAIKAQIAGDRERAELVQQLLKAKDAQRRLDALATSLKNRSYGLRDCVDLFLADYYDTGSAKGSRERRRDAEVSKNVKRMTERRSAKVNKRRKQLPKTR